MPPGVGSLAAATWTTLKRWAAGQADRAAAAGAWQKIPGHSSWCHLFDGAQKEMAMVVIWLRTKVSSPIPYKDSDSEGAPLHQAYARPVAVTNTPGDNLRTDKEATTSHRFTCPLQTQSPSYFSWPRIELGVFVSTPALGLVSFAFFLFNHHPNHLYFIEMTGWIAPYRNRDWVYGKYLDFTG